MLLDIDRALCRGRVVFGGEEEGEGAVRRSYLKARPHTPSTHPGQQRSWAKRLVSLLSDPSFQRQGVKKDYNLHAKYVTKAGMVCE
jgi:hypothetical protein